MEMRGSAKFKSQSDGLNLARTTISAMPMPKGDATPVAGAAASATGGPAGTDSLGVMTEPQA
jgi:hypothetical protein